MPERPPRPCVQVGCPTLVYGPRGTRCPEHPAASGGWASTRTFEQRYGMSRSAWRSLARQIVARDKHRCYLCGRWASGADHKTPVSQGGAPRDPANIAAICDQRDRPDNCHQPKTEHEARAGRARADERRRAGRG